MAPFAASFDLGVRIVDLAAKLFGVIRLKGGQILDCGTNICRDVIISRLLLL